MASGPTDENIENTKRQIRQLVNEVTELSKSDIGAAEFYPAVLQRIVTALAAEGGAIWLIDGEGSLRLSHQIKVDPTLLDGNNPDAMKHGRLLSRLIAQGRAELIPPRSGALDEGEGNPTNSLLVTSPLASPKQTVGLLEVFQRGSAPPDAQRGYLRFIEHITNLIAEWLKGHTLQEVSDRQELWQHADQFARLVHENLDLRDTAFTIANEGRRLIDCDRVSVAIMKGGKAKVIAISGQDSIENRSNTVQSLNTLATRVVRSGESLWYDGGTEDLPPQIEEAIEDYVDLSHGRTVTVMPIRQPERKTEGDVLAARSETNEARVRRNIIGALIVEQIETTLSRSTLEGRVDLVYEHACRALSNSIDHSNILFMPVWKFLDRTLWIFRGSALPKTLSVIGLVGAIILAMFLIPCDLNLPGNGTLKPSIERRIFAHINGIVETVDVKHGQAVSANQRLVALKNDDLDKEISQTEGALAAASGRVYNLKRALGGGEGDKSELIRFGQELSQAQQEEKNKTAELELLKKRKADLERTSPINGVVSTWEVEKVLNTRPVVTGQELMRIMDPAGPWEFEVLLPEKRMRYLDEAFNGVGKSKGYLDVEIKLKNAPEKTYWAKLKPEGVGQRSELDAEDGTVVRLHCEPADEAILKTNLKAGTTILAKVKGNRVSLAFYCFYEVVEWIRAHVLFRIW